MSNAFLSEPWKPLSEGIEPVGANESHDPWAYINDVFRGVPPQPSFPSISSHISQRAELFFSVEIIGGLEPLPHHVYGVP